MWLTQTWALGEWLILELRYWEGKAPNEPGTLCYTQVSRKPAKDGRVVRRI